MKHVTANQKKLKVNREAVRALGVVELAQAIGGAPDPTNGPCGGDSKRTC